MRMLLMNSIVLFLSFYVVFVDTLLLWKRRNSEESPWPGPRYNGRSWVQKDVMYLFAGYGIGEKGSLGYLNDLYLFDGEKWKFSGVGTGVNSPGSYSGSFQYPGGRGGCCVHQLDSKVYVSGGFGYSSGLGYLSDTFIYNFTTESFSFYSGSMQPNEDTLITSENGEYLPYPSNRVGARESPLCFVDHRDSGQPLLYLFGGKGVDSQKHVGLMNGLYCITSSSFDDPPLVTLISGSTERNIAGTYETNNEHPGSRFQSQLWELHDRVYIYGGFGYGETISKGSGYLSDLFKFDFSSKSFIFIQGSKEVLKIEEYPPDSSIPPYLAGSGSFLRKSNDDGNLILNLFGGMTGSSDYLNIFYSFEYHSPPKNVTNENFIFTSQESTNVNGLWYPIIFQNTHSVYLFGGKGVSGEQGSPLGYHSTLYNLQNFEDEDIVTCQDINSTDEKVCSGHGKCISHDECLCFGEFSGFFCELKINGDVDLSLFAKFEVMDVIVLFFIALLVLVGLCTTLVCIVRVKILPKNDESKNKKSFVESIGISHTNKSSSLSPVNKGVFMPGGTLEDRLLTSEEEDEESDTIIMMRDGPLRESEIGRIDPGPPNDNNINTNMVATYGPDSPSQSSLKNKNNNRRRRRKKKEDFIEPIPVLSKELLTFKIDSREFMVGRVIGKGDFSQSVVHNAVLRGESVVIKLFKNYPTEHLRQHVVELSLLVHPSIAYFYGFSVHSELKRRSGSYIGRRKHEKIQDETMLLNIRTMEPLAVSLCLEYCEKKDIRSLWRKSSQRFFGLQDQIEILINIARAVSYLHSQGTIHGHLTSSNILIDRKLNPKLDVSRILGAKISGETYVINDRRELIYFSPELFDFILSSQREKKKEDGIIENYNDEIILSEELSRVVVGRKESDVYSFGVCMYEILTQDFELCEYVDLPPKREDLLNRMQNDPLFRPVMQKNSAGKKEILLYKIIQQTWDFDAEKRPKAKEIVKLLKEIKQLEDEDEDV